MILTDFIANTTKKKAILLIDPDKPRRLTENIAAANRGNIDLILVGGSLVHQRTQPVIHKIKDQTDIPVMLFPGNGLQLAANADGILLLSLISGRNPEYLIGQHVNAAFFIKESGMQVIPTSYLLVESGKATSVSYVSNTQPLPRNKPELIAATAIAGQQLGHKLCYLEAGSGALQHVPTEAVEFTKSQITIPLWVGGGVRTEKAATELCLAGADGIVIGSAAEKNSAIIRIIADAVHR